VQVICTVHKPHKPHIVQDVHRVQAGPIMEDSSRPALSKWERYPNLRNRPPSPYMYILNMSIIMPTRQRSAS
jgi:hypothetical protein